MMAIYKITCNINGKIYIGSAVNFIIRKRQHFDSLRRNCHKNRHLQFAFNKYGESEFVIHVIEQIFSKYLLIEREQYWLDITNCYDKKIGFNIHKKADSALGIKRSEEFKEKIRLHNLNRSPEAKQKVIDAIKKANCGRPSWNKGLKIPPCKKPIIGPNKGKKFPNRKFTPEGYAKICESNRRPRSKSYSKLRSKISSKSYSFISPDSIIINITNLKIFCINNGLNHSRMYQVAKGKESTHKGWKRNMG